MNTVGGKRMNALPADASVVTQRLHLATGFHASEREWVVERLAALGSRLRSYRDDQVDEAKTRSEPRNNRALRSTSDDARDRPDVLDVVAEMTRVARWPLFTISDK